MNQVTWTMSIKDFLSIMTDPFKTVDALRDRIRQVIEAKPLPQTARKPGRPLQAQHPYISQENLVKYRDILKREWNAFTWANKEGKLPTRLASDQEDMLDDEIRLDNGVIAVLNLDLDGVPPTPRLDD